MGEIAFKGNKSRGYEISHLLCVLNKMTSLDCNCCDEDAIYFINNSYGTKFIDGTHFKDSYLYNGYNIYTIEEFEEKYPYKIGDEVLSNNRFGKILTMEWSCLNSEVMYNVCGDNFKEYVYAEDLSFRKKEPLNNIDNIDKIDKIDAELAWDIYNFVNFYKNGEFGIVTLQEALNNNFQSYMNRTSQ